MLEIWQIVLLAVFAGISFVDAMSFMTGAYHNVVLTGVITGLIVGDFELGLLVGGSMQMLALGMAAIGGASIPEYRSATILVVALASISGGMDVAQQYIITFGIPVAALVIQLDVLFKTLNSIYQTRIDRAVETMDTRKIVMFNSLGATSLFLSRFLPVLVGLLIGPNIVELLDAYTPLWLVNGFKIAGGMLPIVGFVILLKFLPTKGNLQYIALGFVLATYFAVPITGIAIIGVILISFLYKNQVTNELEGESDGI